MTTMTTTANSSIEEEEKKMDTNIQEFIHIS